MRPGALTGLRQAWAGLSWLEKVALLFSPVSIGFVLQDQWAFFHGGLSRGQVVGRDFINYWTGSKLMLGGRISEVFSQEAYMSALHRIWGAGVGLHSFSYPPSIFPYVGWTGLLPYPLALALWWLAGLALVWIALWPHGRRRLTAAAVLLSPAVMVCLDTGQNGMLTAALLVGGLRLVDRRPLLAGALIGLASFKPHLGLLIPVALIAAGRWKVVWSAAASALALAAAGTLIAGPQAWRDYLTHAAPFQRHLLEHSTGLFQYMMPSPFMAGRLMGLNLGLSYAIQVATALVCLGLIAFHFFRMRAAGRGFGAPDGLLLTICGFIASPYGFNYDMVSIVLWLVVISRAYPTLDQSPAWRWAVVSLWTAPILMLVVTAALAQRGLTALPVGGALLVIGLVLTWRVCVHQQDSVDLASNETFTAR